MKFVGFFLWWRDQNINDIKYYFLNISSHPLDLRFKVTRQNNASTSFPIRNIHQDWLKVQNLRYRWTYAKPAPFFPIYTCKLLRKQKLCITCPISWNFNCAKLVPLKFRPVKLVHACFLFPANTTTSSETHNENF